MPAMRSASLVVAALGLCLAAGFWWFSTGAGDPPLALIPPHSTSLPGRPELADGPGEGFVVVGGVKRPARDFQRPVAADGHATDDDAGLPLYGVTPAVPRNLNPAVQAAVEAIETKSHPERLSVLVPPRAFDAGAYRENPRAYLDTVEPNRVFATAAPGPDVPRLAPVSPRLQMAQQGEPVELRVQAPPGAPVTFSAFDLGTFTETGLTSVTVAANDQGVAMATFVAPPGTIEDVNVLAGSPLASGQMKFVVNVQPASGDAK